MKANLARATTILALVLAMHALRQANAACGQLSGTVTNLPEIEFAGFQVFGLNNTGQLTGFFFVAGQHAAHAFLYSDGNLSDLGTLGGDVSQGNAINGAGRIAGSSQPFGSVTSHAFVYAGGGLVDLGTLGGSSSSADLVNEAGQVAGSSLTAGDLTREAFLYSDGVLQSLGTLGGNFSSPFALNSVGAVAGQSTTTNNHTHAFLYSGGAMTDLGTLGGTYSSAFGLNNAGIAVGEASVASEDVHAFVFANGTMTDLGTLGGNYSGAFAINNSNQILGSSMLADDVTFHGFVHENGTVTDLGTLGGANTFPFNLNNLGQVIGQSETAADGFHAFLWQNGSMVDLNALLAPGSSWVLEVAIYINETGRIVGIGTKNGISKWFIMDITSGGNNAPVAIAGADQIVEYQTPVVLDGSQSFDPDGDALAFEWTAAGWVLGTNATLSGTFALGTNVVTLKVTDPCGVSAEDTVVVTVVDTTPPVITAASVSPDDISPPNKRMVPVTVTMSATDNSGETSSSILCITANESVEPGDIVITGNLSASLRADRNPSGEGRIYTIKLRSVDTSGNASTTTLTVSVPKGSH